ncbi:hypothetical protein Tco_0099153 [Tanacetum coccineum]
MSKDRLISAFDIDTKKCKTCILTKITKKPYQSVNQETELLELVHSDLRDLHATPSLGYIVYILNRNAIVLGGASVGSGILIIPSEAVPENRYSQKNWSLNEIYDLGG